MRILLEAGADISARDVHGNTAFHMASWAGSAEVVTFLLTVGADPRAKNYQEKPPWDLAQDNEKLQDSEAYLVLQAARFE